MGSALLEKPDLLCSILTNLVSGLSIPVTCKIRLLQEKNGKSCVERTSELLRRIQDTGVSGVTVHARFIPQRPREPAHHNIFDQLKNSIDIPLILNGDVGDWKSVQDLRSKYPHVDSFMIARGMIRLISLLLSVAILL